MTSQPTRRDQRYGPFKLRTLYIGILTAVRKHFFLRNYDDSYSEIYINHGYIFYKVEIFFLKLSFIINILFPLFFCETLYAGRLKLFAEVSKLFSHLVFHLVVVRKTASSEYIFQGAKELEIREGGF